MAIRWMSWCTGAGHWYPVPCRQLTQYYDHINEYTDLPQILLDCIAHFFEQYKALEPDKWVKVKGWEGID